MRRFFTISILFIAGLLGSRAALSETLIHCRRATELGLFEQCETVKLLEKVGDRFRVYSIPAMKVLNVKSSNLFWAASIAEDVRVAALSKAGIESQNLWNTSKAGYLSLCEVHESVEGSSDLLVSCGRHQNQRIPRSMILSIRPFLDSVESPVRATSTLSQRTPAAE